MRLVSIVIACGLAGCGSTSYNKVEEAPCFITGPGPHVGRPGYAKYILVIKDDYLEEQYAWLLQEAKRSGRDITDAYQLRLRRGAVEHAAQHIWDLIVSNGEDGISFDFYRSIATIVVSTNRDLDLREVENKADIISGL